MSARPRLRQAIDSVRPVQSRRYLQQAHIVSVKLGHYGLTIRLSRQGVHGVQQVIGRSPNSGRHPVKVVIVLVQFAGHVNSQGQRGMLRFFSFAIFLSRLKVAGAFYQALSYCQVFFQQQGNRPRQAGKIATINLRPAGPSPGHRLTPSGRIDNRSRLFALAQTYIPPPMQTSPRQQAVNHALNQKIAQGQTGAHWDDFFHAAYGTFCIGSKFNAAYQAPRPSKWHIAPVAFSSDSLCYYVGIKSRQNRPRVKTGLSGPFSKR